jgi:hypothetical protein
MARRKHIVGTCHLCGDNTKLSFEHVPPQAAFNDRPVVQASIEKLIRREADLDKITGKTFQRGAGGYTLCEKCNSLTGGWYGPAYVDWIYQVTRVLLRSKGGPSLYYLYRIFPLRIIKQIISMFFSANGEKFREAQQDLVRFVLNKEGRFLEPHIRMYCFYNRISPDERLFDITFFSEYQYNDWKELGLRLPSLPIYTYFPGDYRSKNEVLSNRHQKNK